MIFACYQHLKLFSLIAKIAEQLGYDIYESENLIQVVDLNLPKTATWQNYVEFYCMTDKPAIINEYRVYDFLSFDFRNDLDNKKFYMISYSSVTMLSQILFALEKQLFTNAWIEDELVDYSLHCYCRILRGF